MPTIIVDVMPKADLLDPQGKAVARALARGGHDAVTGVRIGRRIELELARPLDETTLAEIRHLAQDLLSNSTVEDVVSIRYARTDTAKQPTDTPA